MSIWRMKQDAVERDGNQGKTDLLAQYGAIYLTPPGYHPYPILHVHL